MTFLSSIYHHIKTLSARFPFAVIIASINTILFISFDTLDNAHSSLVETLIPILLVGIIGFALMSAIHLCPTSQKNPYKNPVGVSVFLLLLWFAFPSNIEIWRDIHIWHYALLLMASIFALFIIPFIKQSTSEETVWHYIFTLFKSLLSGFLLSILLFLGVVILFASFDALFDTDILEAIVMEVWGICAFLFGPLFFLSRIPISPLTPVKKSELDPLSRFATKYILLPLWALYAIILYAYILKIVITGDWPQNMVSWMVTFFTLYGVFVFFLSTPLSFWTTRYRQFFWGSFIAPILLLFVAVGIRINEYGFTANRYILILFGLWALGTSIATIIKKQWKWEWILGSLAIGILLIQIGPWSLSSVSFASQSSRLHLLLEAPLDEKISPDTIILKEEHYHEIEEILEYLYRTHRQKKITSLFLDLKTKETNPYELTRSTLEYININPDEISTKWETSHTHSFYFSDPIPLPQRSFDYMIRFDSYGRDKASNKLSLTYQDEVIEIEYQNTSAAIDLSGFFIDLFSKDLNTLNTEDRMITFEEGIFSGMIVINDANKYNDEISIPEGYAFISIKE